MAPTDICLLVPPHLEKWGYKKCFFLAPLANPVLYPHLKIRGAAPGYRSYVAYSGILTLTLTLTVMHS